MRNVVFVEVHERAEQLFHDEGGLLLREVLLLQDVVEQLTAATVLQHQEADVAPLPDLVQLDYVRVVLCTRLIFSVSNLPKPAKC